MGKNCAICFNYKLNRTRKIDEFPFGNTNNLTYKFFSQLKLKLKNEESSNFFWCFAGCPQMKEEFSIIAFCGKRFFYWREAEAFEPKMQSARNWIFLKGSYSSF